MATRQWARSQTSGSWAALTMVVSPSARAAAIRMFSVPPTVTCGKTIWAPFRRALDRGVDVALGQFDLRPHQLQRLEVQVDRTGTDSAAAGQRHPRMAFAGQDRPQHQHRGPHLAHQIIRRGGVGDLGGAHFQHPAVVAAVAVVAVHRQHDPVLGQQVGHGGDVDQVRDVAQGQGLVGGAGWRPSAAGRRSWPRRCGWFL